MKVLAYLRVSTKEQAQEDKFGLSTQRDVVNRWAESHENTILEYYEDKGYSGSNQMRPDLQQLLQDVKSTEAEAVVVPYFDRWARDTFLHLYLEKELKVHDIKLLSATEEGMNDDDPTSELQRTMMSAFAQYERQRITSRMAGGRKKKAESGGHATGRVPFGYKKDEDSGELVIDPEEAEIVKRIYKYRQEPHNFSLRAIAEMLNDNGDRTKKGNKWSAKSVSYILNNKKYQGVLEQNVQGEKITTANKNLEIQ